MPTYLSPGVYVEEVSSGSRPIEGVGTAVAGFIGFASQGPFNTPTLVSNWSQFTEQFGDFVEGCYLAHAVYGYFLNGGGNCYVVRLGGGRDRGNGKSDVPQAMLGPYRVVAKETRSGRSPAEITVEVTDPPQPAEGEPPPAEDRFNLVVKRGGRVVETFDGVTAKRGKENVVTAVRERSKLITLEEPSTAPDAVSTPPRGTVALREAPAAPATPRQMSTEDYVGDAGERTGVGGLEAIDEITMVSAPDLMGAYHRGIVDLESVKAVQLAMIAHCEQMGDRMAVLDPPPSLSAQQMREWRTDLAGYDTAYGALYYPWVKVFDPATGTNVFVPPSGHVAGVWARNDATRGVHKAPANEVIRGAIALETHLTRGEQELLNPNGVNCIRAFPGRGVRIWGARTLSSDPEWRYLNVRRLFNFLEESILNGTQWVVFEPNDDALWAKVRRTISAFLVLQWNSGALFGLTPTEAFFVKCDRETNPAESIDAGQVICEIGVAPVKPAEFVIFRLAQMSGGNSLVSE